MAQRSLPRTRLIVGPSVVALFLAAAWACDSKPPTAPTPTPTPTPTVTTTSFATYQISGRVTNESGAPLPGTLVSVDYSRGDGTTSNPPSKCPFDTWFCWLSIRTDANGDYRVEVEAVPNRIFPDRIGFMYTVLEGYDTNVQVVPAGATKLVQNLRLRRIRAISAGESVSFSIDADSSRCHDADLLFVWQSRCETIWVTTSSAGTLVITAAGGSAPEFHYWGGPGGRITGPRVPTEPATLLLPVLAGTYHIMVGIPDGFPPQRFDIVTSLR